MGSIDEHWDYVSNCELIERVRGTLRHLPALNAALEAGNMVGKRGGWAERGSSGRSTGRDLSYYLDR